MIFHHHNGYAYWYCLGCHQAHSVPVDGSGGQNRNWTWNGSLDKPTLAPSIRCFTPAHAYTGSDGVRVERAERTTCHHFVKEGNIDYCSDCPHSLRGVHPLPDFPDNYGLPGYVWP